MVETTNCQPPLATERVSVKASVFLAVALAVLLAAPFVALVPPGEAPDEPAHLAYVDHLVRHRALPPVGPRPDPRGAPSPFAYESYHPPLAYLVMAGPLYLAGVEHVDYPFYSDPDFAFQRNRRSFLASPSSVRETEARRALYMARATNVLWLALASGSILVTCLRVSSSPWTAFGAGVPFALSPQLLFTASTVGNDAAAVAVAPALALVTAWMARAHRPRVVLSLVLPGLVLSSGWVALEVLRTGTILPSPPTGWHGGGGFVRLLTEPRWLLSAWGGYWAKFGWLNVSLPWPAYLAFVPPTLLALLGLCLVCRTRSKAGGVLVAVATANIFLLVVFMVRVDWQPQGRYLLPSSAALAGLAALGLDRACLALRADTARRVVLSSCLLAVLAAAGSLLAVAAVY